MECEFKLLDFGHFAFKFCGNGTASHTLSAFRSKHSSVPAHRWSTLRVSNWDELRNALRKCAAALIDRSNWAAPVQCWNFSTWNSPNFCILKPVVQSGSQTVCTSSDQKNVRCITISARNANHSRTLTSRSVWCSNFWDSPNCQSCKQHLTCIQHP